MSLQLDKSGWKRVSLGEIAAASKERVDPTDGSVDRFVAGEHMDTDDLKIHRWGDPAEIDLIPPFTVASVLARSFMDHAGLT